MKSPQFRPGRNMAMKVPAHEYESVVRFYRETLGLTEIDGAVDSATETCRFAFGDRVLWIDRMTGLSQTEVWLEVITEDIEEAATWLESRGCTRRDEIEPLPEGFRGFWIAAPGNVIHLVTVDETT